MSREREGHIFSRSCQGSTAQHFTLEVKDTDGMSIAKVTNTTLQTGR